VKNGLKWLIEALIENPSFDTIAFPFRSHAFDTG
jgi:hypothetical protein